MDLRRKRRLELYIATQCGGDRGLLIKRSKLSKGRITQLLDPDAAFGERAARSLSKKLRLSPGYFEEDDGVPLLGGAALLEEYPPVPVLSYIQAGKMKEIGYVLDLHEIGDAKYIRSHRAVGARSWALIVDGFSMNDGSQKAFLPGDYIICDPDRGWDTGSLVIAKDVSRQEATFKKLFKDEGRWLLKPLNRDPIYQAIEIDDPDVRVIAKVDHRVPQTVFFDD